MILQADACYRALKARDARFDGCFFVGVRSTRVYCRPICPAKTPRRENCAFFANAAVAEAHGYRPCLRCRPELAPGEASVDANGRLARMAATALDGGALEDGLASLAASLQVTDRHLRRVFAAHYGVSPIAYAQTQRLLLAKRLLTDTNLNVTEIAFASGFGSLRRFNALFRHRYGLNPSSLRRREKRHAHVLSIDAMTFNLAFRPPYDWSAIVQFLGSRAIDGVEEVSANEYRRAVRIERRNNIYIGWIAISPLGGKAALRVLVSSSLLNAVGQTLTRVKHLTDVAADPRAIAAVLGPVASRHPGLRVPGAFDGFELAVRAIIGQQISVKAARTIAGRFAAAFGPAIETPFAKVSRLFPSAPDVAALETESIVKLGIVGSRALAITALARSIARGELILAPGADVSATLSRLRAIPGVGEWTAQYIAMRAIAWPDAFPHTDLGLRKALREKNPAAILKVGEVWRPWRAYAAMHLWTALAS